MIKRRTFITTLALGAAAKAADIRPAGGAINRARIRYDQAGFSPDSLSGLKLWLKADALALADNAAVVSWTDSSGLGNHAAQATEAKKPTYKTAIQNGKPIIRFDGTDDVLVTASIAHPAEWTVFVVSKYSTGAFPQQVVNIDNPTIRHSQIRYDSAISFLLVGFNTIVGAFTDAQANTATNFEVIEALRTTSALQTIVNGASNGATATTGTNISGSNVIALGGDSAGPGAQPLNGDIAEVIYYDTALSAPNRSLVRAYLGTKYGITVA